MSLLTFDIGGTFIKYALADERDILSGKGKVPTPQDSREALIETLSAIYKKSTEKAQLDGIAVSMPGIIDSERGYVYMGGALEYNNGFAIRDALGEKCGEKKITVNNDAKCAAQAEASLGALSDVKDGAVIINTSRGAVLNEADVAEALCSGKLGGAGLDVLAKEPADPANPLLKAPNTVITPHCAWTSKEARLRLLDALDANLGSFLETGKGINRVF